MSQPVAMDQHVAGADERAADADGLIEPRGWEFYGRPSEEAMGGCERRRRRSAFR